MEILEQLSMFSDEISVIEKNIKKSRSGTFLDNMKLPIHRWFRYSAGFSAEWVNDILEKNSASVVLDPFVGSGTVCVVADKLGIPSYGVESHPFVFRLAMGKLSWDKSLILFESAIDELIGESQKIRKELHFEKLPELIRKCYSLDNILDLYHIKNAFITLSPYWDSGVKNLVFLAVNSILRLTSYVGTAQWQYILPAKRKARVLNPYYALSLQAKIMSNDMIFFQNMVKKSNAILLNSDARNLNGVPDNIIDFVVTSPPYANNYDYADATRLEMTFWGEVASWGDLHERVRQYLIRSSSQHVSRDRLNLSGLLEDPILAPINVELSSICYKLDEIRRTKGGNKAYHLMLAAYLTDMAKTFQSLRRVMKNNSNICLVIGDSAPYGVHAPIEKWLGELALASGFNSWHFEKIRDRNTKWKNRKHNVPLHEGHLLIKG